MQYRKAHFIGIGGVGMSAVAKLLRDSGVDISGSDEAVYPPISTFLEKEGIPYNTPYAALNIPADADLIVIGKNAKLVPETNAEVASAMQSGTKILSFPDVLAELSAGKETVVVAGSYGKSTTASLLAHCLLSAGLNPSYFIGAIPKTPPTSAAAGSGEYFVLEGDEYPASNTDPRSKFLLMHPKHLLITPLAHDHFNVFPTPLDYLRPFFELMDLPPQDGTVVVCAEGALTGEFLQNISRPVVTYGLHNGDFQAKDIAWGETTTFVITKGGEELVRVETSQLGEHNIQNIVGVAAFVFSRGLMSTEQFAHAIRSFEGVVRRMDRKSTKTSVPVYEGFGSAYDKLKSAIAAMKQHFPTRRLVVVFEPNTISWRSRAAFGQYDDVFEGASTAYIFNPPHDGKATEVSAEEIAQRVAAAGVPATAFSSPQDVLARLAEDLGQNDCVLISSSGAMGGLPDSIPRLLEEKFPV